MVSKSSYIGLTKHSRSAIAKGLIGGPAAAGSRPLAPAIEIQLSSQGNTMSKIKFRPLHDRVVVKRIVAEEKTKGGIIIPDSAKEKPQEGEVVAVGPGGRDEAGKLLPIDIKTGSSLPASSRPPDQ
eukprot:gene6200-8389_t